MPLLNPDHLLDQAERLVAVPPGGGAPRQADLRRAISSAYYALFHAILAAAADDLAGKNNRQTRRYSLVYRSADHASVRGLCNILRSEGYKRNGELPAKYIPIEPAGGFGDDLIRVATAFSALQDKRHQADYDPLYRTNASDARLAISEARDALSSFRNATAQKRKAFLSLVLFSPR